MPQDDSRVENQCIGSKRQPPTRKTSPGRGPHSVKPASRNRLVDPNDTVSRSQQVAVKRTYTNEIRSKPESGSAILLADAQLRDDGLVALGVVLLQIVQQTTSLADHHKKTAAGRMVLLVRAEMIRKLPNTFAQNSNLNFRAPRVIRVGGVLRDDIGFMLSC